MKGTGPWPVGTMCTPGKYVNFLNTGHFYQFCFFRFYFPLDNLRFARCAVIWRYYTILHLDSDEKNTYSRFQ
jgi:hypothetical protein